MGPDQGGRAERRQGHQSELAFLRFKPTTTTADRREPGTKWSIYWLNEKIAFFPDCQRILHLMFAMQGTRPVMGSASLLSRDTRKLNLLID